VWSLCHSPEAPNGFVLAFAGGSEIRASEAWLHVALQLSAGGPESVNGDEGVKPPWNDSSKCIAEVGR
jgi:hypothetical protein